MFSAIGIDKAPYDYSGLATVAQSSPTAVGSLIDTSGVKSGSLVVAIFEADVATNADILISVVSAWKTPNGSLVFDMGSPLATLTIGAGTITGSELRRVDFTGNLPGPGIMVFVQGRRTAGTGNILATLSIGIEMLNS